MVLLGRGDINQGVKHQSNFGYFRKGPFETLNMVKHARLECVERQEVSHAKTNQILRLFSEGCIHCNVLFFAQPKKNNVKDLNTTKHFTVNITRGNRWRFDQSSSGHPCAVKWCLNSRKKWIFFLRRQALH